MSEVWTVRKVLGWTTQHFDKRGVDSPRLTAEVLLAFSLKTDRVRIYLDLDRPLEAPELAGYRALIARRSAGEPTQGVIVSQRQLPARDVPQFAPPAQ